MKSKITEPGNKLPDYSTPSYNDKSAVADDERLLMRLKPDSASPPHRSQPSEIAGSSDLLTVLEVIGVPTLMVDDSGMILAGNPGLAELSGRLAESMKGTSAVDLLDSISIDEPEWSGCEEQLDCTKCHCTRSIRTSDNGHATTVAVSCVRFGPSGKYPNLTLCTIHQQSGREHLHKSLQEATDRLQGCQVELHQKSIAINEMLSALEAEKRRIVAEIRSNIERTVMPVIHRLKHQMPKEQQSCLNGLEQLIQDVTSPFVQLLSTISPNLTTREVEICNLIRQGMSSKQISSHLCTSEETVRAQRKAIRKKLGISNKKNVSLRLALDRL